MISCERAFYLKNSYPSKNIAAMKLATLVAAALLAVNTILYASDPVKIGDKYYYEDAAGNLILAPEGSVREAPKRRPMRSGKYGMPHPYSWHSDIGAAPSQKTTRSEKTESSGKTSTSDALREKIAAARELAENPKAGCAKKNIKEKEELEYYSCKIVEIKGGNRRLLGNAEFSMPAQADVPENIVLAECGETRIVAEISKRQN